MRTEATTIDAFLATLTDDRREAIAAVLAKIRETIPKGYEEGMAWGMITWQVPLAVYPDTYNKKPLMYAALASQKSHLAVYLCNVYGMPELRARFEARFRASGKKLDMGQSCVRFKKLSDLPLDVIGEAIAATPMDAYVAHVKTIYAGTKTGQKKAKVAAKAEVKAAPKVEIAAKVKVAPKVKVASKAKAT